ncbi:MAG: hypothetical protein MJ075_06045 [Oscillospiraceae bacterium]|nr:hypothetical protein [Oscillospiraceae bacterium]
MKITAEEKLMYSVMKAIFDSGIPINFKGSMVLKACLMEAGYVEDMRHTVDIDANWYSDTAPTAAQMLESLQGAIEKSGINLRVSLYRMYGEGRSAGFELIDPTTEDILFTMDMDVNRPMSPTKLYEVAGVKFRGVAPVQMIADKVFVLSTDKVFRRVKDVVDLYYISQVIPLDKSMLIETLQNSERVLDTFDGFLHRVDDLRHSYEKFRFAGDVEKPSFDDVYYTVRTYVKDILPKERNRDYVR